MKVAASDIRAFVHRERSRVQQAKRDHWARTARVAPKVNVRVSHALYEHARRVAPEFPSQRARDADLAHHVRLKGLIDRASRALAVRRSSR